MILGVSVFNISRGGGLIHLKELLNNSFNNQKSFKKIILWANREILDQINDNALLIDDHLHSEDEDCFILLGLSSRSKMLVVCHCYRENDEVIRIISARKASRKESKTYRNKFFNI